MRLSFPKRSGFIAKMRSAAYLLKALGIGHEQYDLLRYYLQIGLSDEQPDGKHLHEAMRWLSRAQDICQGKGVSCVFDLKSGWGVAYPETSGYIIATFLAYAELTRDWEYIERAVRIGDWEIDIQTPDGGILSSPHHSYTRVFNSGQVILGWCALYEKTHSSKYLCAAKSAGEYLLRIQESDGSWEKDTYCGARTYHARVDWSLLRLAVLTGDDRFASSAIANIVWVLKQQRSNGWFEKCGFNDNQPIMHVIVYTLRGLLESHLTVPSGLGHLNILSAVIRSADALCNAVRNQCVKGIPWMVPTSFNEYWISSDGHSCLTGNAQLACFLFRLAQATENESYRTVAENVLQVTKRTQLLNASFDQIRGAIGGSYPLYDGYHPNSYPNWATKFFADALMMKVGFKQHRTVLG